MSFLAASSDLPLAATRSLYSPIYTWTFLLISLRPSLPLLDKPDRVPRCHEALHFPFPPFRLQEFSPPSPRTLRLHSSLLNICLNSPSFRDFFKSFCHSSLGPPEAVYPQPSRCFLRAENNSFSSQFPSCRVQPKFIPPTKNRFTVFWKPYPCRECVLLSLIFRSLRPPPARWRPLLSSKVFFSPIPKSPANRVWAFTLI